MEINLIGMDDSQKQMERISRGAAAMEKYNAYLGSYLPYAWGEEFGRHRVSGKLARGKGGAMYLTKAIESVLSNADHDISEGLNKVTAPGPWVLKRLGLWARRLARQNAPKGPKKKGHSYRLRRSINTRLRKR